MRIFLHVRAQRFTMCSVSLQTEGQLGNTLLGNLIQSAVGQRSKGSTTWSDYKLHWVRPSDQLHFKMTSASTVSAWLFRFGSTQMIVAKLSSFFNVHPNLFWRQVLVPQECSMTPIPEICITLHKNHLKHWSSGSSHLRVLLAQVKQGPVQSHHPPSLAGHCHAGDKTGLLAERHFH